MTVVVGTVVSGTTPTVTLTVPALVTSGMAALIVFATATSTDWDPVPAKSGATFTLIDDRAAGNLRVTVWTGTGLVAGDTITTSATINSGCGIWHSYRDDYTYNVASVQAAIRGGSTAVSLTGSLTPTAAQQVAVVGVERTTATPTTVSSVVSNGGETVTQQSYFELAGIVTSVYTGDFTASAAASRTVTITYSDASANGYGALITMTPAAAPPAPPAVWPAAPQDLAVDLFLGGAWVPIKTYVRRDPGVTITRGRPDEASFPSASLMRLALNNRDGRFSPRLPTGAYYGLIGRNTPIRASLPATTSWLSVDTATGTTGAIGVSTPDSGDLDIVGDIDIRFDADLDSWREPMLMVSKWTETGNQRSYSFELTSGPNSGPSVNPLAGAGPGLLRLVHSTDGTNAGRVAADSTVPVPVTEGRLAVRATLDVDNGAAGKTWTFYTGTGGVNGSWTQLGSPVTTAGTTSIFSGTGIGYILNNPGNGGALDPRFLSIVVRGRIYAAQIQSGIGGTIRANPDFSLQTAGGTSFVDTSLATAKTWTLVGAVSLVNRNIRYSGQVPSWSVGTDPSGTDVYTDVEASGKLRQLGQGASPIAATLENLALKINASDSVAYWPCTEADGAFQFASGLAGGKPLNFRRTIVAIIHGVGVPTLAAYEGNLKSSSALPILASSLWKGAVNSYPARTTILTGFLLAIPTAEANNTILFRLSTSGVVAITDIIYTTASGGGLKFISYDSAGTALWTGTALTGYNDTELYVSLYMSVVAGQVVVKLHILNLSDGSLAQDNSSPFSTTIGSAVLVTVNPGFGGVTSALGAISVRSTNAAIVSLDSDLVAQGAARAYVGEAAGRRIERLCQEASVDFKGVGDLDDTELMGAQLPGTLFELLQQGVDADLGILFEPREFLGLGYRARASIQGQASRLPLDYAQAQLDALQPVEDDQAIRNDVTVTRTEGSSSRATLASGALSVQQPPAGVGVYDDAVEVNYYTDAQAADAASWRLRVGTVDEARFPLIPLTMQGAHLTSLIPQIVDFDIGDRLTITNLPAWLPPDTVRQILQGYTEFLSNFEWELTLNCSPAVALDQVGFWAGDPAHVSRYSPDGSALNATMTTTATNVVVSTPTGPLWITTALVPADFPFDIIVAGEAMTVTAVVAATATTQTFTVTRSVNGVVKTHASGEAVALLNPSYYAL